MPRYVDGFVIPILKKNLPAYRSMAKKASKVFMEHGAVEFRESVGDDLKASFAMPFTKMVKLKAGETVLFSWVVFKSRKDRDKANKKIMADPRLNAMMDPKKMPFDISRMVYGGFKLIVDEG